MPDWQTEFTGPDGDGYIWVTVLRDGVESTLCLGPKDIAMEAASQFLGSLEEVDPPL